MNSGSANAAQSRVSGVNYDRNINFDQEPTPNAKSLQLNWRSAAKLATQFKTRSAAYLSNLKTQLNSDQLDRQPQEATARVERQHINYSSSAQLPVDVDSADQLDSGAFGIERVELPDSDCNHQTHLKLSEQPKATPIDDYWVRKPSDRKWGTLTLAATKLAERRAREQQQAQQNQIDDDCDTFYYQAASSRTLPSSFKRIQLPSTTSPLQMLDHSIQAESIQAKPPQVLPRQSRQLTSTTFGHSKMSAVTTQHSNAGLYQPQHHQRSFSQIEPNAANFFPIRNQFVEQSRYVEQPFAYLPANMSAGHQQLVGFAARRSGSLLH